MALAVKDLPGMNAPVVADPDHWEKPVSDGQHKDEHRIHVRRGAGGWDWAHLLRAVGGWQVVAAGTLPVDVYRSSSDAAAYLSKQAMGADGDGIDRLAHEAYTQLKPGGDAHLILEDEPERTYCGGAPGKPAVFNTRVKGHATQCCIDCDNAYRAAHFGRCAVTH